MNLTEYIDTLQQELAVAAEAGGEDARALAERLTAPLHSATRLVLLDALSAAADEITRDLAPGSVELRLRGREPEFAVTLPDEITSRGDDSGDDGDSVPSSAQTVPFDDDGGTARLNLRLPEALKARIDEAAGAAGLSLNAWLLRAAAAALAAAPPPSSPDRRPRLGGDSYQGWVR